MNLAELRDRLTGVDDEILRLVGERQRLASAIGRAKRESGSPTRDWQREKQVIDHARATAVSLGVAPAVAEALLHTLIRSSLARQEREGVAAEDIGGGRTAVILGGAGRIGRWMAAFLASQGFSVTIADPAGPVDGFDFARDGLAAAVDADVVVVAAPLAATAGLLLDLAARRPRGLVFDVGSLKGPLREGLAALRQAGCRVTSIHPMFGPDTDLLSGRHVVLVDVGVPEATEGAREIFASTMATLVEMGLDEHDRLMGWVLGLSHAVSIVFFRALAEGGEPADRLARISSTTFQAQLEVSRRVAAENPDLYFEIQQRNPAGLPPLEALLLAVTDLVRQVREGDEAGFVATMARGANYLAGLPNPSSRDPITKGRV